MANTKVQTERKKKKKKKRIVERKRGGEEFHSFLPGMYANIFPIRK